MSSLHSEGWQPLGSNRRLVNDLLYFSRGIPLFPIEREFDLSALSRLRDRADVRVAWPVLFVKAYGMLAARLPELRQSYHGWPWAHLYQHRQSVAMVAVSRRMPVGERLFWARFVAPDEQPLAELQAELDRYKTAPVEDVFRRQIRLSHFPTPLRRIAWWLSLHASGARRAKRLGTFGLSTVASSGAINRFHPSCLTTSLSYGPLSATGKSLVTIVCDHRVVDGAPMARALAELEAILAGPIADELAGLARHTTAA